MENDGVESPFIKEREGNIDNIYNLSNISEENLEQFDIHTPNLRRQSTITNQ